MALKKTAPTSRAFGFVRVLLIVAAALAVMVIATAIFGMGGSGPSLEFAPDPAGLSLPF